MVKNYKFNSISLNTDDGILENIFGVENVNQKVNLSNYDLKELKNYTFYYNSNIKEVILPKNLEIIGDYCLHNCYNLEKVVIPESVKDIGTHFLENTAIYNDENNWSGNCFCYGGWLISFRDGDVVIPNNLKLHSGTAVYKVGVTSIHFSESIKEIPSTFIISMDGVTKITFDTNSKLERIDSYAFGVPNLTEIEIPKSIKYLGIAAVRSNKLEKVYIKDLKAFCSIIRGGNTFDTQYDIYLNNSILKNIIFPSDLDKIGLSVFAYSNIESITIPNSVKQIEGYSFYNCKKLKNIVFNGTTIEWKNIYKGLNWKTNVPATYVQCTDGQVQL